MISDVIDISPGNLPAPAKLVYISEAAAAKSLQSCPTLCDPIDGSPPGSPIPGILQARTMEWVAISFPNAWKWKVKVKPLSRVWLLVTPWTVASQAPPSMGFSRQEYWSGPFQRLLIHIFKMNNLTNTKSNIISVAKHAPYPNFNNPEELPRIEKTYIIKIFINRNNLMSI